MVNVKVFANEFMKRYPGDKQLEVLYAINGDRAGVWNSDYHEIALEIGMKGGKNWILEIDAAFTAYYIECLLDPHAYFSHVTKRLIPYSVDKTFDLINVSVVDEKQAQRAFFDSVKKAIKLTIDPKTGDNWFERYTDLDLREEYGDLKRKEIVFPTRQRGAGGIRVMSFNSAAAAPEGLHMLKFYADELSRANTKAKYIEAQKLYSLGLMNTAVSFPNRIGKTVGWAYPNDTEYDLAHERYELSLKEESIFGLRLSTYQFNPSVTRDFFLDQYRADPIDAAMKFDCIKPLSRNNFYQPHAFKLEEAINPGLKNVVEYMQQIRTVVTKDGKENKRTGVEILSLKGDKRDRCFAFDASKTKDRFVIAGGYNETIDPLKIELMLDNKSEILVTNKKPIVDFLMVIEPKDKCPVDYPGIGNIFTAIINHFPNTRKISSDHFQNEKVRQEIENKGINAETYAFGNAMQVRLYTLKRWEVWTNNIEICNDDYEHHKIKIGSRLVSPSELWLLEGQKLIKEGPKIDHPKDFSKDVQDAVVILVNDLMKLEVEGVSGMASSLDTMTDEKFRELVFLYMDKKRELLVAETSDELISPLLCEKLNMNANDIKTLAKYVKEKYDY
jgi:hypothetical protein